MHISNTPPSSPSPPPPPSSPSPPRFDPAWLLPWRYRLKPFERLLVAIGFIEATVEALRDGRANDARWYWGRFGSTRGPNPRLTQGEAARLAFDLLMAATRTESPKRRERLLRRYELWLARARAARP